MSNPYDPLLDMMASGAGGECRTDLLDFLVTGDLFAAINEPEPDHPDYQPFRLFPQATWHVDSTVERIDDLRRGDRVTELVTFMVGLRPMAYYLYLARLMEQNGLTFEDTYPEDMGGQGLMDWTRIGDIVKVFQNGQSQRVPTPVVELAHFENRDIYSYQADDPDGQVRRLIEERGAEETYAAASAGVEEMPVLLVKRCDPERSNFRIPAHTTDSWLGQEYPSLNDEEE